MSATSQLRRRLDDPRLLVVPGAANALTARIIEDAGFEAIYVTGAGVANTYLGVPDVGLLTLSQLVDHVAAMRDAVDVPLIVDADTGFGNAINTAHTVRLLERAGANAIQIEDQTFPKRCGHFDGKDVIPCDEMVQKVRAAVEARRDDLVIIARTDARASEGVDGAVERARAYRQAGADVLFIEALTSEQELERVITDVPGPQLINIVRGGRTPELPRERLEEIGFRIALYANLPLLAQIAGVQRALEALGSDDVDAADHLLASWAERQRLVGLEDLERTAERYRVPTEG